MRSKLFRMTVLTATLLLALGCGKKPPQQALLSDLLPLFTADNVPQDGPAEDLFLGDRFGWMSDRTTDPAWPGEGLARYPMIYIGEGYNRIHIVADGEVVWKYDTGPGNELDDIWMLQNGDILFTRMYWAAKVTPDKREVWRYDCKEGEEIHVIQPVGDEEAFMLINAFPARVVWFNHNTGEILWEKELEFDVNSTHVQSRRMRYTKDGTWLLSYLKENKVVEFDKDWNIIWQYDCDQPWAAVRLASGNTLITLEREKKTVEVDPGKNIVWEISLDEIPEPYRLADCQSVVRLQSGNTILCSRGGGGRNPQLVEVTPDKEVVWVVDDWKNLGPATTVQILSEKGLSEHPGDFER